MTDMDTIRLLPPFEHIRGSGYRAILPEPFEHMGNTAENVFMSPLRLLENGQPYCRDYLGSQGATCNWQSYFAPEHWEYARQRLEWRRAANDR